MISMNATSAAIAPFVPVILAFVGLCFVIGFLFMYVTKRRHEDEAETVKPPFEEAPPRVR